MFDPKWWLDAAQWVVTGAVAVFVWLRKPGEEANTAISKMREDFGEVIHDHARRIATIETHMEHMPDEGEFRQLEGQVREVAQGLTGLRDSLQPIRESLRRIEDYLLRGANK